MIGNIDILTMFFIILFIIFLYLTIKNTENVEFGFNSYFKKVDIYQGRSHWTKLKNLLITKK